MQTNRHCSSSKAWAQSPCQLVQTRHAFLGGAAHDSLNLLQLIQFILAGEDGLSNQQLGKDAAHAPHVDLCVVLLSTQQQLRRSAIGEQTGTTKNRQCCTLGCRYSMILAAL